VLNYLRAGALEVALLLNFGPRPQIRRFAFSNTRKGNVHVNHYGIVLSHARLINPIRVHLR
jgi:hypothetical protein